jgi:tetratricopeptide (TPR) repeat protein
MIKRLVISYSTTDRDIAEKVRNQLIKAGYEVWIAHNDIRGSVDWTQAILNAVESHDGLVLVWSESAAKSDDVHEEICLARVFLKPIFPIHAHPMREVTPLPQEIANLQVIHMGSFDANMAELQERLANPDKHNIQYSVLAKNGFIPKEQNENFVGRSQELKTLFIDTRGYHGGTRKGVPIAIAGLGGIGKTDLALTFAYRFNLFFHEGVYWVDALNGIVPAYCNQVGPHLGVERFRDERPGDYATRVLEKLRLLRDGLIVFDNVTDFSEFRQWCPTGNRSCSVILTTRLSPRGFATRVINLTELDADSAYQLLVARRKDREQLNDEQRNALKEICRITGNHPLALELCASRLQSEFIQPSDYLQEIQPDPLGQLSDELSFDAGNASLVEILRRSYASLDQKTVDHYFLLMCCFAPHGINEELIVHAYGKPEEGRRALDQLASISFIRRELSNNTLSLHPLVSQFGRSLQKDTDFDYPGKFTEVMIGFLRAHEDNLAGKEVYKEKHHIDAALRVAQDRELWKSCATLYEYEAAVEAGVQKKIEALQKAYQIVEQNFPQQKSWLLNLHLRLGRVRRTAGQLKDALDDFNQAEVLYYEFENVDPAEVASLRFELGATYLALGRYAEAEITLSDALRIALTDLDDSAPEVLQLRQALAERALNLGNYAAAEQGFTKILEYRNKFYIAHPDATSSAGLAAARANLSRLALARAQYTQALKAANGALTIIKEYYKESDPEYNDLYLLLGTIHYEAGDYRLAEEQLDQARRNFAITFGEGHPGYARTLIALGEVYRKQGTFAKAEKEVERAIAIFEHIYGAFHPFVAEALEVRAKIYDHRCEFEKEQEVWERILAIQNKFYSPLHPALAFTHYDYASLFLRKGEYAKAAEHLTQSLEITEKSLGKNHVEYFACWVRLATCRYEQQEYSLAQKSLDSAKVLQKAIFGDSIHPYIARMLQLESEILRRRGEFKEALKIIEQAIGMKKTIYGTENHPSVAESLEVKVMILHHLGEKIEAKLLIDRTLMIRQKAYGMNHPDVSSSLHDLGTYFLRLGQYKEAIAKFEQARQITQDVFGTGHPDYIERTLHLANAHYEQGEYRLALALVTEVKDTIPAWNRLLAARRMQLLGELQRRMGEFDKALESIEQAIAMKEKIYGTHDHPSVAEALGVQAKIYDHRGEFGKEQILWERILAIQKRFYSPQHPALALTHYDYASLFLRKGEYAKAVEHLSESLTITEASLGKKHVEYFGGLVRLATCYYQQQEDSLAQSALNKAKELREAIFGNSLHPYIARMLQLQSEILRQQSKLAEALEAADRAIAMKKAIYGEEHPSVAEALETKADSMLIQLRVADAREILDTIERIRRKAYGKNHPEYANYQLRQARCYEIEGNFDQASEILEQSLQTCLNVFSSEHPETIKRQVMLARIDRMTNHLSDAERRIKRVCETLEAKLETEDSLTVAEVVQELSTIRSAQGNYRAAQAELEKALRIKEKILGSESPAVIELQTENVKLLIVFQRLTEADEIITTALRKINPNQPLYKLLRSGLIAQRAILQDRNGQYDQAIKNVDEAISLRKDLLGENDVALAKLYIEKAVVLRHQSKYKDALENLTAAQNIDNLFHFDENHVYFARILLEQGRTHLDKNSLLIATEYLNEALRIYDSQPDGNVKQHADAVEALGQVYLISGRPREAFEMFEKAFQIRTAIYDSSHPEITITLQHQEKALLRILETCGTENLKIKMQQKLENVRKLLRQPATDQAPSASGEPS